MKWPAWLRWLFWPLELFYRVFLRLRTAAYRRGWLRCERLSVRVLSVGNLTVGGTGKTPMVIRLARWLRQRGVHVAILTRGYGRRVRAPLVINGLGEVTKYTSEMMGDEPILLARRLPDVTLGIGADRVRLGRRILEMEAPRPPQVFLLDDGFQHLRLARDLDLVLLDSTNPFGNGAVLPAGPLREPPRALRRAGLVVLTRADGESQADRLAAQVRRWNPGAPLFRACTRLAGVFEAATDRRAELAPLQQEPSLAFCGVGNPQAFADDLRRWGFNLVGALAFPDHHRYAVDDFKLIIPQADRVGARLLLTTEKDRVNLAVVPPSYPPTFYCQVELELEDEAGFFAAVAERLHLGN